MAIKAQEGGVAWGQWPDALSSGNRKPWLHRENPHEEIGSMRLPSSSSINSGRRSGNTPIKGHPIIGDIPIFVGMTARMSGS